MKEFKWRELLTQHSLFSDVNPTEVRRIIDQLLDQKVSDEKEYSKGAIIVREGELGHTVFLLGSGSVEVLLEGEDERETTVATLKPGEFFGEMSLLERKPRAATVRAVEDSTLLEINGQEFLKLLDEHKDVESKMLLKLSERLRHANEQVVAVKLKGVDAKLKLFNEKVDAELKAVDASLKAALAVFEQTKLSAHQIIISAERSRARLVWLFGIVATLVSIATAFGIKEIIDLKQYANQAQNAMLTIDNTHTAVKKMVPNIERFRNISQTLDRVIQFTYQPQFQEALLSGTQEEINNSYSYLQTFHMHTTWFLDDVEIAIVSRPKRDYTNILRNILRDTENPDERTRAHYLLLTSAILTDKSEMFEKQFQIFKTYVEKRGPFKYDLSALESLFEQEKSDRQKRFKQVLELIPTPEDR